MKKAKVVTSHAIQAFLMIFLGTITVDQVGGQEYVLFENENGNPNAVYGWDIFSGFYPQPHENTFGDSIAIITAAPAGGVVSSTGNLYSFFTVPTFTVSLTELQTAEPFTSVAIQLALTEIIDVTSFSQLPTEFIDLGVRTTIGFEGSEIDVHYYWVQWEGLDASSAYDFSVELLGMHVVLTAARVAYFNTSTPWQITFGEKVLLGDVNCDGVINLLDVSPFVELISSGGFSDKADINLDGEVNLQDIGPFIDLLTG